MLRSRVAWEISNDWTAAPDLTSYTANLVFLLMGTQTFVAPTGAFPNGSFRQSDQDLRYDHHIWNAPAVVAHDRRLAANAELVEPWRRA
ncbi:hypothetical protein [uncultured Sphingomonas sp.]|uniref:hypothetical protein n=1 Tax=uncultured Sphingomonas sp. TaxID=158754 RepID=UPI0025D8F851|nr:hypothetical protein [uncultured Sphingomonas sp.]